MSRKELIFIIVGIIIFVLFLSLAIIGFVSKNNDKKEISTSPVEDQQEVIPPVEEENEEEEPIIIKDLANESISLEKLNDESLSEYLKLVVMLFREKDYNEFSDEDISVLVAYHFLVNKGKGTNEEIKDYVERMFGRYDFELQVGEYVSPLGETVIISEKDGKFSSNLGGKGVIGPTNIYKSKEVKISTVVAYYDYVQISNMGPDEVRNVIGKTAVHLRLINGFLKIEKIVYTKE